MPEQPTKPEAQQVPRRSFSEFQEYRRIPSLLMLIRELKLFLRDCSSVLDIGCGGGLDSMMAAIMTGPTGRVVGVDLSPEMVARARHNLESAALENVMFHDSVSAEALPFPDSSFDAVVSNGVFNLVPDKIKAVSEVFRVLKPDGRLMMADQILVGELSQDLRSGIDHWAG